MKKFKKIVTICLATVILFNVPVIASNTSKNISIFYKDIKIKINSQLKPSDKEPFIYNDTTYVPLRFISESLNANVEWDKNTNTISITQSSTSGQEGISAVEKAKAFCGDAYDVYRATEAVYIKNILYIHVEASHSTRDSKEDIYYNCTDKKLYAYNDGEISIFQ